MSITLQCTIKLNATDEFWVEIAMDGPGLAIYTTSVMAITLILTKKSYATKMFSTPNLAANTSAMKVKSH